MEGALVAVARGDGARHVTARDIRPALVCALSFHVAATPCASTVSVVNPVSFRTTARRGGDIARVAPRDLEQRAPKKLRAIEERRVRVVELERHLVGPDVALLVGET